MPRSAVIQQSKKSWVVAINATGGHDQHYMRPESGRRTAETEG